MFSPFFFVLWKAKEPKPFRCQRQLKRLSLSCEIMPVRFTAADAGYSREFAIALK
jgi:hypothetical protein